MNRVCMIVLSCYPNDERVRREAEALERAGVSVDIICLRDEGQSDEESFGLVTAHRVLDERPKEGIASYLLFSVRFMAAAFFKLQKLNRERDYQVIQVHNMPDFLVFAAAAQKILGRKPLVLDLHDLTVELYRSKWGGSKATFLMPMVKLMEKASCSFANELITASAGFEECLQSRGFPAEKIHLVLNTADPHIFQYHEDRRFESIEREAKLLYHGTIAHRFGLVYAIEAVKYLQETVPGTTLHIYGKYDPSCRDELDAKVRELGLEDRVFLEGFQPLETIIELINQADMGVAPYLSDVFTNLILPTKLLEYTAMGLPVVASRLEGITNVFDDMCIEFAETESARDFAGAVARLCRDPERRAQMAKNARRVVDRVSWPVMEERYVSLMKSLIDGRRERVPVAVPEAEETSAD